MRMTLQQCFGGLAMALALAGCGSSASVSISAPSKDALSQEVDARCDEFAPGSQVIAAPDPALCANCSVDGADQAADGRDASFATLSFGPLSHGPLRLRASAPDGQTYAGRRAAAVTLGVDQSTGPLQVVVTTFLDGAEQETDCDASVNFQPAERRVLGPLTTLPFDALEITLLRTEYQVADTECGVQVLSSSNPTRAVDPVSLRVHEFCADFRL